MIETTGEGGGRGDVKNLRARSQTNGGDPYRWLYRAAINNLMEKPAIRDSSKTNRSSSPRAYLPRNLT